MRILFRIVGVNSIDSRCFQDDVRFDFPGSQSGGSIRRHKRTAGSSGQDGDSAFFEMTDAAPADERLSDSFHADGGLLPCGHTGETPKGSPGACGTVRRRTPTCMCAHPMGGRMGGGVFSPSLMMGALTGLAFGLMATAIFGKYAGLDAEQALRTSLRRFEARFRHMETELGGSVTGHDLDTMMAAWNAAKAVEG